MLQPERLRWFYRLLGVWIVPDARWRANPLRRGAADSLSIWLVKIPVRVVRWIIWVCSAVVRARRLRTLYLREGSGTAAQAASTGSAFGLERCDIRYINLDHRTDRREQFEAEMVRLGVTWHQRVVGVRDKNGSLGCRLSHINVLSEWNPSPGRLLMVCEDDVTFNCNAAEINKLLDEFAANPALKVLLLAHNSAWHVPASDAFGISADALTTACYAIKPEILRDLSDSFRKSAAMLAAGVPRHRAAGDVVWRELQKVQVFATTRKRCVVQRPSYSDTEYRPTDYGV